MCCLAAAFRMMGNPLNILVSSSSGAGKSTWQVRARKVKTMTLSEQSLLQYPM